jgi:hypothetical protein
VSIFKIATSAARTNIDESCETPGTVAKRQSGGKKQREG